MPHYQLRYLGPADAMETIEAADPDAAETRARFRLLFREPGLEIAIFAGGDELRRVTQRPRPTRTWH